MKYVIQGGESGKERLQILGQIMNPYSLSALIKAGIQEGFTCLDAGCGGGTMTYELSKLVGGNGFVKGFDFDPMIIELNHEELKSKDAKNIQFQIQDIYDFSEVGKYDLVFARYLLSHLDRPTDALGILLSALKPDGIILIEDVQFSGHICYPSHPAFDQYIKWYTTLISMKGANAELGCELPLLFKKFGVLNVHVNIAQPLGIDGVVKHLSIITLEKIKYALLDSGLTDEGNFHRVSEELAQISRDQHTLMSIARTYQVSGRKTFEAN